MSEQEKYEDFLTHLPVTASDRVLMALKGHLLVEQALREFVYKRIARPNCLKDKQIAFATILDFAASLEHADSMNWVWEAARKLNRLRNLLAHNLSPLKIEELEEQFISYVQAHDGELAVLIGNEPIEYERLSLAIFQVYDCIISRAYISPADLALIESRSSVSDDRLRFAIDKALLVCDEERPRGRNTLGPIPRKKWPSKK
jgi:hypothetical protein